MHSKNERISCECGSSTKCFSAECLTYFRVLSFEAEYLEWDGVRLQTRKDLNFEQEYPWDHDPYSNNLKRARIFTQEAYQVLQKRISKNIKCIHRMVLGNPTNLVPISSTHDRRNACRIDWWVLSSSLSLRCWIIDVERGRLYLSYCRVFHAECKGFTTPFSHCFHPFFQIIVTPKPRTSFLRATTTWNRVCDGWWSTHLDFTMHHKATTRICERFFFILPVETKRCNRRIPLPDVAEEDIARFPYWIGGYDLDTHVRKSPRYFAHSQLSRDT
jgi:hypothetical protein